MLAASLGVTTLTFRPPENMEWMAMLDLLVLVDTGPPYDQFSTWVYLRCCSALALS
jgi:hypothetical protein